MIAIKDVFVEKLSEKTMCETVLEDMSVNVRFCVKVSLKTATKAAVSSLL